MPIVSYVPLFMFAILFGLSMDYEVFLVSQIEEHVHEGEDNKQLGRLGLVTSARVITAAAAIMVFVFGSFVLNGDPTVKQFGVGLAVAVILDATVVRCLLVPALMVADGQDQLVHAALARPHRPARQHRGCGVLRTEGSPGTTRARARAGGGRLRAGPSPESGQAAAAWLLLGRDRSEQAPGHGEAAVATADGREVRAMPVRAAQVCRFAAHGRSRSRIAPERPGPRHRSSGVSGRRRRRRAARRSKDPDARRRDRTTAALGQRGLCASQHPGRVRDGVQSR